MKFSNVDFILFKPQLAENIGFCARALKNFNFKNLNLVSPKVDFTNKKVLATSVGAKDVIYSGKIYKKFEDAIKNVNFNEKVAIIFGPESSGLTNDELSYANYVVKIPTSKNFQSLNLSHCVILFCYEIFKILSKKIGKFKSSYKNKTLNKNDLNKFINFLIISLDQIGFLQPRQKRRSMVNNIRTLFHKLNLSEKEMRILLGIFSSLKGKKVD